MQILIIASQENLTEFEDHLVTVCGKLCSRPGDISPLPPVTTLLHLSASLGLTRLTCSLLHWAAESPGPQLAREVDALALDSEGYTPLVSAELQLLHKGRASVISCLMYLMSVNTEENK